ncbi:MAG: DUF58 domain-containing protein [Anaerolineae bacterium]|nr:DUF58 domain-containing protein [Anaerolineae bacterium]
MSNLPSQSWHGSSPAISETQLRYTPLYKLNPPPLYKRVIAALRSDTYELLDRDVETGRFWLRMALGLMLIGMIFRSQFLLGSGLCVLTFVAVSWIWERVSLYALRYRRTISETRVFLDETVTLTQEVRNPKPVPLLNLEIEDLFPAVLPIEGAKVTYNRTTNRSEFRSYWSPGAFQRLTRHYTLQCVKRGYHFFGPTKLTIGDGAGLFGRTLLAKNQQTLIVYPRLYSAAELRLPAKNPFGEWVSKAQLFEDPLRNAGIREWQPADGLRRVHWKATAHHQRMLSRLYEPSEEPQVLIFLNVATLERYWEGVVPELMERTISVAGSLAALCVEQRWPVGLIANAHWPGSDQSMRLLPGRSPVQLTHILEMLAAIDLPSRPIEVQLMREAPKLPWGATLLVVTAVVYDDLLSALQSLVHAGRKVVLFALAEIPPELPLTGIKVYQLSHLITDVLIPSEIA